MENQPRHSRHIFLLVSFLLLSVLAATAFLSAAYFIYSKKLPLFRLSNELSGIADEEKEYHALKKTIADTIGEQAALDSYFIDPDNFVPFVEGIEALGEHARVALTVESAALTDANRTLTLTLFTGGAFEQTLYFLSLLEAYPAKITFDRAWIAQSVAVRGQQSPSKPWEGRFILKFASN